MVLAVTGSERSVPAGVTGRRRWNSRGGPPASPDARKVLGDLQQIKLSRVEYDWLWAKIEQWTLEGAEQRLQEQLQTRMDQLQRLEKHRQERYQTRMDQLQGLEQQWQEHSQTMANLLQKVEARLPGQPSDWLLCISLLA